MLVLIAGGGRTGARCRRLVRQGVASSEKDSEGTVSFAGGQDSLLSTGSAPSCLHHGASIRAWAYLAG